MIAYEKLGAFYLGRQYDLHTNQLKEDIVLYEDEYIRILEWLEKIDVRFHEDDIFIGKLRYVDMLEKCTDYQV